MVAGHNEGMIKDCIIPVIGLHVLHICATDPPEGSTLPSGSSNSGHNEGMIKDCIIPVIGLQ